MKRKMTDDEKDYIKRHPDAIVCLDESLTKQSFAEECDINEILRRAANGQDLSATLNTRVAQYGDFTNIPDFRESLDLVNRANAAFMQFDWQLRERFANDPARLMDFLNDDKNLDEAVKLGIVTPKAKDKSALADASAAPGGAEPK